MPRGRKPAQKPSPVAEDLPSDLEAADDQSDTQDDFETSSVVSVESVDSDVDSDEESEEDTQRPKKFKLPPSAADYTVVEHCVPPEQCLTQLHPTRFEIASVLARWTKHLSHVPVDTSAWPDATDAATIARCMLREGKIPYSIKRLVGVRVEGLTLHKFYELVPLGAIKDF